MAKQLDLQEQEQVDAIKAFWNQYGNLITWTVTIALGAFAAWNGWNWYQRKQAAQASTLYGQLEDAARSGDVSRAQAVFGDMKAREPSALRAIVKPSTYTQQGGLLLAKVQSEKDKADDALASLKWVADNGNAENAAVAHLRAAGVLADQKKYDEAIKQLDEVKLPAFAALASDRRGDVLLAKGDREGAKTGRTAPPGTAMPATMQYRILVDAKLTALGAAARRRAKSASGRRRGPPMKATSAQFLASSTRCSPAARRARRGRAGRRLRERHGQADPARAEPGQDRRPRGLEAQLLELRRPGRRGRGQDLRDRRRARRHRRRGCRHRQGAVARHARRPSVHRRRHRRPLHRRGHARRRRRRVRERQGAVRKHVESAVVTAPFVAGERVLRARGRPLRDRVRRPRRPQALDVRQAG
jgi:predicted negative regulator of RcsB-dependent stress response